VNQRIDSVGSLLVVPCFNEAHRWQPEYWNDLTGSNGVHWLFVNDGSQDATSSILRDLSRRPNVDFIDFPVNSGKGEAIRIGMLRALGNRANGIESVGFMDADGAFRRPDVERFAERFAELAGGTDVDAVWSSRVALAGRDIRRSQRRHYIGRAVATLLSLGADPLPYDTQSGLKFFRPSETLYACISRPFATRWLFEIEILTRWRDISGRSMRIREEPLEFWQDVGGSSIRGAELVRVAREIATIKMLQRKHLEEAEPKAKGRNRT